MRRVILAFAACVVGLSSATAADVPEFHGDAAFSIQWRTSGGVSRGPRGTHDLGKLPALFHIDAFGWWLGVLPEQAITGDGRWEYGGYTARRGTFRLGLDPASEVQQRAFFLDYAKRATGLDLVEPRQAFDFRGRFVRRGSRGRARLALVSTYAETSGGRLVRLTYRIDHRLRSDR